MKRAFLQKVKPVSCPSSLEDAVAGQPEPAPLGAKRRARTSAAMIGLALSMGASSLLVPHHNDGAKAAEPNEDEATASSVSQIAAVPSPTKAESIAASTPSVMPTVTPTVTMVEYVVRDGQTLWQIARKHHVSVESLAAANGLSRSAILRVGQTLKVPVAISALTDSMVRFEAEAVPERPAARATGSQQLVASTELVALPAQTVSGLDQTARTERDAALNRLRQERERLKGSLAELRSEGSESSDAVKEQQISAVSTGRLATEQSAPLASRNNGATSQQPVALPSVLPQSVLQPGTAIAEVNLQSLPYRVQPGDTVETIARSHRVSEEAIVAANRLPDPDWIRVSQSLTIPAAPAAGNLPVALSDSSTPAVVAQAVPPDSSVLISTRTTATPGLTTTASEQSLAQPETTLPTTIAHQVRPGETIAKIARTYSIPQSLLIDANRLGNPNVIFVGQVLQVPMAQPVRVNGSVQIASAEDSVLLPSTQVEVTQPANASRSLAAVPAAETSGAAALSETIPATNAAASGPNPYVAGLLSEVKALRARQQSASLADAQQPAVVAASTVVPSTPELSVGGAINPQAVPSNQAPGALTGAQARVPAPSPAAPAPQSNLVAAAPLGSERYDPLVPSVTGRMVSPDLPPLPGADRFLPGQIFNGYSWPARGILTSGYGWRWGRMHQGIDIAADVGTPIYAAAEGVVEFAGWNSGGYGNMVEVRHADGSMTRYAHLNAIHVRSGQQVSQGEQIAEMGSTGYSTGPHLHFEVHLPSRGTVNPIAYLPQR